MKFHKNTEPYGRVSHVVVSRYQHAVERSQLLLDSRGPEHRHCVEECSWKCVFEFDFRIVLGLGVADHFGSPCNMCEWTLYVILPNSLYTTFCERCGQSPVELGPATPPLFVRAKRPLLAVSAMN